MSKKMQLFFNKQQSENNLQIITTKKGKKGVNDGRKLNHTRITWLANQSIVFSMGLQTKFKNL